MRGGRYQQKAIDDVNSRNAEALFETRTVVEIREVESRTRKEIEEKKEELRQLVGASYRDLIDSADSILLMRESCEAVASNLKRMEEGFETVRDSISLSTVSPESDSERKRRESLFGLGGRVKYLVDTPEKIWGCLDEHMYLEGSQRYLRAKEVHSLLTGTAVESNELFATFPLLRHQWPLVETFRSQISQRSKDRLQESGLSVDEYAIALAATGIIDELPAAQIFSLFLESKRTWLRAYLRTANAGPERLWEKTVLSKFEKRSQRGGETGIPDLLRTGEKAGVIGSNPDAVAEILCRLGHMIQVSLCHIGELFLEVSGKMPLLFRTALAAPPVSQLFGGIPNPEREVHLWGAHRDKLESSMNLLPAKSITEACRSWLRKCAVDIVDEGSLLLQHVKSGRDLADVEGIVRKDLAKQVAVNTSLEWLKSAFGGALDSHSPWDCLCELLLKEPVSLWEEMFENLFVSRMKEVVDMGFQDIRVDGVLDQILFSSADFPLASKQVEKAPSKDSLRYLGGGNRRSSAGMDSSGSLWKSMVDRKELNASSFAPEVIKFKDRVDEGLRDVLEDSLCFFQGPQSSSRSDKLAPYIQEQCHQCVSNIVKAIESRLSELSENMTATGNPSYTDTTESDADDGSSHSAAVNGKLSKAGGRDSFQMSKTVERALFLGRLAAALGQHATYLPIILGSPAHIWSARVAMVNTRGSPGPLGRQVSSAGRLPLVSDNVDRWFPKRGKTGSIGADDGSPKLRELQRMLRHQSVAAHSIWVSWSTEDLTTGFSKDLQNDNCLSTSTALKGWEETVLKQEEENGGEVEMKLALPAMPSPYLLSFLFAGCQEIYRVGGHVLDRAVLRLFAWQLCLKVMAAYKTFFSDPSVFTSRVSEKGLLQLVFDIRFLADILSGGQDVNWEDLDHEDRGKIIGVSGVGSRSMKVTSMHSEPSVQEMKKSVAALQSEVLSKLDPIDWATYEPHLWENECRYYQRCAVLFGSLVQLNRLYTETTLRHTSPADANILNLTGSVPRFTYLPISTPIFSVSGNPGPRTSRGLSQDDSLSGLWSLANGDDVFDYRSPVIPAQSAAVGARPLIRSFMGQVGSRFGEGLKFGLLSDKSAAAISNLGDMLPVQASGLFSSFTAGAPKES